MVPTYLWGPQEWPFTTSKSFHWQGLTLIVMCKLNAIYILFSQNLTRYDRSGVYSVSYYILRNRNVTALVHTIITILLLLCYCPQWLFMPKVRKKLPTLHCIIYIVQSVNMVISAYPLHFYCDPNRDTVQTTGQLGIQLPLRNHSCWGRGWCSHYGHRYCGLFVLCILYKWKETRTRCN